MPKKTILFITHYFPPEVNAPANRTYEHCRLWTKDANVVIITNFPNHPKGEIFEGYKNRFHQKEMIEGIQVHRLLTYIAANKGFIRRIFNYVFFMFAAVIYAIFSRIKFDVVIATTPQFFCGLAGKYISKIKRKPFILELRDLWPESIIAVGAIQNRSVIKLLEKIELNLYKSASKIISVTKSFKENLVKRGIEEKKIEVFYNGITREMFTSPEQISDLALREFLSNGFIIGYIGTIGMAHSLETLVETAEKLKGTDVKIVIVGSGARENYIKDLINEKNLQNIQLFPLQPKSQIPAIIEKLDLFLVHLKKTPLFRTVIPSKIFEGMAMKKPILMGVEGESRGILNDANCSINFEPENTKDLTDKILGTLNNQEKLKSLGQNGYNYVLKNFNREIIADEYLKLILNSN